MPAIAVSPPFLHVRGPVEISPVGTTPALDIITAALSGTIERTAYPSIVSPTGALVGKSIDLSNVTLVGPTAVTGLRILTPVTARASTAGEGLLVLDSQATAARVIDAAIANTSGTAAILRYRAATVLAGALTGIDVDLITSVTPGAVAISGVTIQVPATTSASSTVAGLIVNSRATTQGCAIFNTRASAPNAIGGNAVVGLTWDAATTLTAAAAGFFVDFINNLTQGSNQCRPFLTQIGTNSSTASAGFAVIATGGYQGMGFFADLRNNACTQGMFRGASGAANTLSGVYRGMVLDLSTNVTPGANEVSGIIVTIPATTRAVTFGEGALVINSRATAQIAIDIAQRCTGNSTGMVVIRHDAATTITAQHIGFSVDFVTNITMGANRVQGFVVQFTTGTATNSAGFHCLTTAGYRGLSFHADVRQNAMAAGALRIETTAANALAGNYLGIVVDLATNVTPGANVIQGVDVTIPNTSDNTSSGVRVTVNTGSAAVALRLLQNANANGIICTTQATSQEAFLLDSQGNNSASIMQFRQRSTTNTAGLFSIIYGAATVLTGAVIGFELDLNTNSTPGANAVTGIRINTPATTRANTAGEGAIFVDSRATAARVLDLALANTSGTPVIVRYRAATTPAPVTMMTLDLSTNVNSNANANIGLDIPIVAADEDTTAPLRMNTQRHFVGTGVPNNANGSDNDIYFRIDGGGAGATHIYFKNAGAWIGIA